VEEQATTNMTVITSKRMYFFEMHAEEAVSVNDESLNFVVKFVYPEQFQYGGVTSVSDQVKPDPSQPEKYNYDYSISGNAKNIEPTQVFDDGEFTFFKFKDVNAEIPAMFMVNRDGSEALVNFRVSGGYIIVERVADRFTLRRGSDTICVFNEKSDHKKPEKKRFLIF
jgi:type IV secretion system protein VirB9